MVGAVEELSWPAARLAEAMAALGRASGLGAPGQELESLPSSLDARDPEVLGRWLEATAAHLGLDAEATVASYAEAGSLVRRAAPALLTLTGGAEPPRFLAILRGGRSRVSVVTPGYLVRRIDAEAVRAVLCAPLEAPAEKDVAQLLDQADVPPGRRAGARRALLEERLRASPIQGCWLLRASPTARLPMQAHTTRLPHRLLAVAGVHATQYGLWLLSWWLLGRALLGGRMDFGWLGAWALLVITVIQLRLLASFMAGRLSLDAGALLRRHLLQGSIRLEPEEVRHQGAGELLGRVIESEAVESMALAGGFLTLTGGIETVGAAVVLGLGAGGAGHALLLLGWLAVLMLLAVGYGRRRRSWTAARLGITSQFVERMLGQRTRLAQQPRARWHEGEDEALDLYVEQSRKLDRCGLGLEAVAARGWLILGLLGLAPAFVAGGVSSAALAVGVGGVLLAYRAFRALAAGTEQLIGAAVAWEHIALFSRAASRAEPTGQPALASAALRRPDVPHGRPLLDVRDLAFRHPGRATPAIDGVRLRVCHGDRLLLEGPSGGGKSTLAALLAASRTPDTGLLLLDGFDLATLGTQEWRHRVALVPQFHENHVLLGSLAFNLLMGRRWPPRRRDLEDAAAVCRALGLGPLLERMPGGLDQPVGETGWQLSHGERSRLFLARAILQEPEVLILDESFGALDPGTLGRALAFVLDKAPTLILIAHP